MIAQMRVKIQYGRKVRLAHNNAVVIKRADRIVDLEILRYPVSSSALLGLDVPLCLLATNCGRLANGSSSRVRFGISDGNDLPGSI